MRMGRGARPHEEISNLKQPNYKHQKKQREEAKRRKADSKRQRKEPAAQPGASLPQG
jgi:hypothetical protein